MRAMSSDTRAVWSRSIASSSTPAFRWIDVAEEIAFLLMDLEARHAPLQAAGVSCDI
jgi:hypothetical protein